MEKDWVEYKCNSGKTLFLYNKVTGEHKYTCELGQGLQYRIMHGHPAMYKEFCTVATQTDDNGCSNGCMSVYINTCRSRVNPSEVTLPPQPQSISNEGKSFSSESGLENALTFEHRDTQEKGQSLKIVTANKGILVENSCDNNDNSNNDSETIFRDTKRHLEKVLEVLGVQVETECSSANAMIQKDSDKHKSDDIEANDDNDTNEPAIDDVADSPEKRQQNIIAGQYHECFDCHKVFKSRSMLERHFIVHTGERNFECVYCKKKYGYRSHLKSHLRTHTGKNLLECSYCKKQCIDKSTLEKHILVHTKEKPFECSYCDKKYTRKSCLNIHIRNHTGFRPHQCSHCEKKFTSKVALRSHAMVHSDVKAFECSVCVKKFAQRSSLYTHMKTHTGAKPN